MPLKLHSIRIGMTTKRILIVDDEPAMRRYLQRLIGPHQYEVQSANDGVEALEALRAESADLVISDLTMPNMDGLTLLERMREEGIDSAFILLTAHSDLNTALAARDRFHIANFVVKPIHNQDQFLFDIDSALYFRELEIRNRQLMEALTASNADLENKVRERTRELSRKNEELARLSEFRGDVLRVLSHELRTPLAILTGYLGLQKPDHAGAEPRQFVMMESALERIQGIVDKSIQRIREAENTHFDLDLAPVDPSALCALVVDRINPLLTRRKVRIDLECEETGECQWDRSRVENIIEELLINAVRASEDDTRIVLSVSSGADSVEIGVMDRGTGISQGELTRIFEPFVTLGKVERHTSGLLDYRAQGVGLGLSIAKILAELQQGQLIAESNAGEPGTTFRLILPRTVRQP